MIISRRSGLTSLAASVLGVAAMSLLGAPALAKDGAAPAHRVDAAFVHANATGKTPDWPSVGLDYAETRFSKLDQINAGNAKDLGLVWSYDLESTRGIEATPLVVDGVMYVSASWSVVHAIDARTGKRLWTFDPEVDKGAVGMKGCCDAVNRGVALWKGKVYVGVYDGRLIALDAATGKVVWEKNTFEGQKGSYTITGAPRVYKGKVLIGNGGAEYGVRGYITAYDAETGVQKWRWYTVPGDPAKPYENEAMKAAAKTWDPAGRYWEHGGGGTVWDTMAFDPDLDTLYIGTGNASPWSAAERSPAGGDNLYVASIVALDPDTGEYRWHYQQTPGDNWDFTSTQPMILADLKMDGKPRKVILHAPKNGFFFVIDRTNGKFISAQNFVPVNWASGYDKNGRPIETPDARVVDRAREIYPSAYGARNWHSMSFNPTTGLAYMPAQNVPLNMLANMDWKNNDKAKNLGEPHSTLGWNTAMFFAADPPQGKPFGRLIAWDPVAQKEKWVVEHVSPWNGGTLTTAGNLVFQGTADARFVAYDARDGKKLWEVPTGTGVVAAPSTYEIDGKQYVSIAVGWGGVYGLAARASDRKGPGTVYTFALGGTAKAPPFVDYKLGALLQGVPYDKTHVEAGGALYLSSCVICHGVPGVDRGGNVPNLGYSATEVIANLDKFVFNGPYVNNGMPDFTGKLQPDEVEKIKAFIQGTADAVRPK